MAHNFIMVYDKYDIIIISFAYEIPFCVYYNIDTTLLISGFSINGM